MTFRAALMLGMAIYSGPVVGAQQPRAAGMGFDFAGLSFVAIQVSDEAQAADWYGAVLGLVEVNRLEGPEGRYRIRILSSPGLTVELIRVEGAGAAPIDPRLGIFKAGFYVDDIEAAHVWLQRNGVDADQSIFTDTALRARTFVFRDLEGNRLQVLERCETECPP